MCLGFFACTSLHFSSGSAGRFILRSLAEIQDICKKKLTNKHSLPAHRGQPSTIWVKLAFFAYFSRLKPKIKWLPWRVTAAAIRMLLVALAHTPTLTNTYVQFWLSLLLLLLLFRLLQPIFQHYLHILFIDILFFLIAALLLITFFTSLQ